MVAPTFSHKNEQMWKKVQPLILSNSFAFIASAKEGVSVIH